MHPERFLAFGFISVAYSPPAPDMDVDKINAWTKQALGYEEMGYWLAGDLWVHRVGRLTACLGILCPSLMQAS